VQWIHQRQINGGPLERCCPKGDRHSLPGASTLDPPHVSFNHQSYTSLIYIFYSNLYITNINLTHSYLQVLMFNPRCVPWTPWYTCFILWHSTCQCLAVLWCRGYAPCTGTHLSPYGTALADTQPVLVHMFNPSSDMHI